MTIRNSEDYWSIGALVGFLFIVGWYFVVSRMRHIDPSAELQAKIDKRKREKADGQSNRM